MKEHQPAVFRDTEELANRLASDGVKNSFKMIGLDGEDGCGKSILATNLSQELGAFHIEVDRFLDKNKGGYLPYIRYDDLKRQLENAISSQSVIIEGVCLLDVLEQIGKQPDVFVYMKRLGPQGIWYSEDLLEPDEYAEDPLEMIRRRQAVALGVPVEEHEVRRNLEVEIVEYHKKYKPAQAAHYIFERLENP